MKNIVLSGYYGFNNTGDEAVLASMIQTLRQEMSHIDLTVLSHNPEQTERRYEVQAVNRWRLGRIIPAIRACDLFISGGGSLLQDVTGAKSILYYLALIQLARWLKKPVMIYAQGIGPVNRIWARKLMSKILNKVNFISVRDQVSADDLKRWGISRPRIIVTADPVMGWDPPDTGFVPEGLRTCVIGQGLTLVNWLIYVIIWLKEAFTWCFYLSIFLGILLCAGKWHRK